MSLKFEVLKESRDYWTGLRSLVISLASEAHNSINMFIATV